MPKYLIERRLPNAGKLTPAELHAISAQSNSVLGGMQKDGTPYHWLQTFVTDDALYCVHVAPSEAAVREHARCGGFPVDNVYPIRTIIDPTTGE
jgi:hypothetical protein